MVGMIAGPVKRAATNDAYRKTDVVKKKKKRGGGVGHGRGASSTAFQRAARKRMIPGVVYTKYGPLV